MKRLRSFAHDHRIITVLLAAAFVLRCYNIAFGLPSLFDPDEGSFVLISLGMLNEQTINPHWFGHPGTTTLYVLALIEAGIFLVGFLMGKFSDSHGLLQWVYSDPSMLFLWGRLFVAACGTACVLLTYLIGRRLFDHRTGLVAAALLAINSLHVSWSQVIRTDIHATVFMLCCVLVSIDIARGGRLRDYVLAAVAVGLACATKWPAAVVLVCPVGAGLIRAMQDPAGARKQLGYVVLTPIMSLLALIAVSPYLVLDYRQAFANMISEAQPHHLGATGGGFLANALWYLTGPIGGSVGAAGLAFGLAGAVLAAMRGRLPLAILLFPFLILFAVNSAQNIIWARWALPLLPFACLFIALAVIAAADGAKKRLGQGSPTPIQIAITAALMFPMLLSTRTSVTERLHDTRSLASAWARENIPAGSSVIIEYFAFDLIHQGWTLLLPASHEGCIDGVKSLRKETSYSTVSKWRRGHSVVNIGTLDPEKLDTCRADYAIVSEYDRYVAERGHYPRELATYGKFLRGGIPVRTFRPRPGELGGPVMRIIRLNVPGADYGSR